LYGDLSHHMAGAVEAERLREARERAPRRATPAAGDGAPAHERTRARVLASLLLARRSDSPTRRRWAEE
jgi:hypothetical protein